MCQSQPFQPYFTIALTEPDQVGLEALDADERRDHDALLYEGRRRDWLAGRLAAKRAVAGHFGIDRLDRIRLERRPGQAPLAFIQDESGWRSLPSSLSIGHTDGWSIAAAADRDCRIGVDIDRVDAVDATHARYFLTARERRRAATGQVARLWVQKEAAWKALGLGDSNAFTDLELHLDDDLIARSASVRGSRVDVGAAVWAPAHGLMAAAVWAREAA
jgi:4'-phosphopantetheinyl transferase EntD